jgi:Zn-dependent protease with chaperone function
MKAAMVLLLAGDCAIAAITTCLLNWLALIPFRRAKDMHWTERARRLWPARTGAAASIWLLPADIVLGQRLLDPENTAPWPLAALAAWFGAVIATYAFDREVFPWITPRAWRHQVVAAWTMRFAIWFLFFGIAAVMPAQLDWRAWTLVGIFCAAFVVWARGGLLWSWQMLRLIGPAPERLASIVASVSSRMQPPFRKVWLLRISAGAAYALPYTRDLLFSERLLELHPDEEIAAICAHELGHLGESRMMLAGRLTGFLFCLPLLFVKPVILTWGPGGVMGLLVASWLLLIGRQRLSRKLEKRADAIAKANESEPGTYARALARLHEANLIPAVMARQRTHPDLYDRLLAAGVQPDFPRPEKPSTWALHTVVLWILFGVLAGVNVARFSGY